MPFTWSSVHRPIVALAPMAGVTDAAFRQVIKRLAPDVLLYTEFVSTNAMAHGSTKTRAMLEFDSLLERPIVVQVFGADPSILVEACKEIEALGVDGIDINMGCPAAKIVSSCYGSALIQKPELAQELVHSVVRAVKIPVSVKTRLGWDTDATLVPFVGGLIDAGATAIAIHGRTYKEKFTGKARWEPIYELKRAFPSVPILGNGDIFSGADAIEKLGNLDGILIGRGCIGNPWIFQEVIDALRTGKASVPPETEDERRKVFSERIPVILDHLRLSCELKGERTGVLEMRKSWSGYVQGFAGAKDLRVMLMGMERMDDVWNVLQKSA
jgi:nifR3 family TIM-barrel protein